MKGQFGFVLLGIIGTIAILVGLILPVFFLRIHLVAEVEFETKSDSAQLLLLTLLSSTTDGKPTSQIITEHIAFGKYPNINQILAEKIGKYTDCFQISADGKTLADETTIAKTTPQGSQSCNPTKYTSETSIPLPYSQQKNTVTIQMGIG